MYHEEALRHADETDEESRRTQLASERTYLAWLRTGFAALAVSRVGVVPMKVDHLEECDG